MEGFRMENETDSARATQILSEVKPENAFIFNLSEGEFTGKIAQNLSQLFEIIKTVELRSVEFHLKRGDFEKWIGDLGDNILAMWLAKVREAHLEGEVLRERVVNAIGKRINKLKSLEASP
jgi:hypothetical protein